MTRLLSLVAVLGVSIGADAWAQSAPLPNDSAVVRNCLEKADDDLGYACIGVVSGPCAAAVKGDPAKTRACMTRELAVWEAQVEAALRRIRAGGFRELSEEVARSQDSWKASVRGLCSRFDKIDPGMMPGGSTACSMHATAGRALLLRRLGDAVNEH
ncbi:MAG TPA: hypothetical protein VFE12_14565 [Acetobacteraceae bacterium]|nr:hypothetical protein [Acetobacteraceae bacterium]